MTTTPIAPGDWQERDVVARRPVYLAFAALVTLVVGGVVITWLVRTGPTAPPAPTRSAVLEASQRPRMDGLVQSLFDTNPRGSTGRDARPGDAAIDYRWVDRDRRIATVPIDRAMDLIAGGTDVR